jgi:hypothetical protein
MGRTQITSPGKASGKLAILEKSYRWIRPATHSSTMSPNLNFDGMCRALNGGEDISMMKHLTLSLALVVAMMAIAAEAQATPITGGISFGGFANPMGGSDWSTATGVSFINPALAGSGTGPIQDISCSCNLQ